MKSPRFRLLLVFLVVTLVAALAAWRSVVQQERELRFRAWREYLNDQIGRLETEVSSDPKLEASRKADIEYYRSELKSLNSN